MHATVLKYFREVAERGAIRKAAEALHVASSAVNRQILKLEDEIGVPLFERLPTGVRLTTAGEVLLRHVADTLNDFDLVKSEIDEFRGLKTGLVRVAALVGVMTEFLPRVVAEFQAVHPGVNFLLNSAGPEEIVDEVAAGRADIAVNFEDTLASVGGTVVEVGDLDEVGQLMLADAQTSGGLLVAVDAPLERAFLQALAATGLTVFIIDSGHLVSSFQRPRRSLRTPGVS